MKEEKDEMNKKTSAKLSGDWLVAVLGTIWPSTLVFDVDKLK